MKKNLSTSNLSNASWAHKYGITKENTYNPSGLGMNPNLNIEDQYVQNLLKQIHFMNLEVKLLKEKQQQSEGNGLWGIVNRSKEPLVKNIVDSNQKYLEMRHKADGDYFKVDEENIKLANHQNALLKKYHYLQQKLANLEKLKRDHEIANVFKQTKILEKIKDHEAKLKATATDRQHEAKRNLQLVNQFQMMTLESQKEKSAMNHDLSKIRNDQIIEEIMLKEKMDAIEDLKTKIDRLKQEMKQDQSYQNALKADGLIKINIIFLNNGIAAAEFELMQINQSIKLAEKQKQKEIIERKRLQQELQFSSNMLKEIQALNLIRKEKQFAKRKNESVDVQKGQYQTKKLQKNLEQIKKKLNRSEQSQKVIRIEVQNLERQLARLRAKHHDLSTQLSKILEFNSGQEVTLSTITAQLLKLQDQSERAVNSELSSCCELNDVQRQIYFLRERRMFLNEHLQGLKDTINATRLQELQKVVQKNNDVNDTVGKLMSKWEEIKQFSKI